MNQRELSHLLALTQHLAKALPKKDADDPSEFAHALVQNIAHLSNADAVAILLKKDNTLVPIANEGLSLDSAGRRFDLHAHPRLQAIAQSRTPIRFDHHSHLPDPYDGLLLAQSGKVPVHACMGFSLHHDDELLAVVTLDSLAPDAFDNLDTAFLNHVQNICATYLALALYSEQLKHQTRQGSHLVSELSQGDFEMVGNSAPMRQLKNDIQLVASSDFTILIHGETGTGKELVARNIHKASLRADHIFLQVNCASLPEQLAESELFGHRKGAFTGADKHRDGKFLLAHGGTLFLDEIGELPLSTQSKLLRVLQSGEIQPVGEDQPHHVDVRIIAATNRNLKEEVAAGRFRADLYHRLSVYPIQAPPLRERVSDIALLAGYFAEQIRKKLGIGQLTLNSALIDHLKTYDWPGNVRELEHVISRAALRAHQAQWQHPIVRINPSDCELLPRQINAPQRPISPQSTSLKDAVEDVQKTMIRQQLDANKLNWAACARSLDMDRANLVRLAKRLGIVVNKNLSDKNK